MKRTLISILVANLFVVSGAYAGERAATGAPESAPEVAAGTGGGTGLVWSGSASLGLRHVRVKTADPSKFREYRDLDSGTTPIGVLDVRATSDRYYFSVFGENLGQDDQYIDIRGGQYGFWKFRLFDNELRHRFGAGPGGRTPFSGAGTPTLTGTFPNTNVNSWNTFDDSYTRRDLGGFVEWSALTPWYFRADANEVRRNGIKTLAGALGTSPGNGSIDLPSPVDFTTRNAAVEAGYQSTKSHFAVSFLSSKFTNDNPYLRWTNPFFGSGMDTTILPADNDLWRLSANGNVRGLPMGSTLAGRVTYSKITNDVSVLPTMLSTLGTTPSTAASTPLFQGEIVNTTGAASLNSHPLTNLDTRLYYSYSRKDNNSTQITFTPTAASGLQCGGPCTNELFNYTKNNAGLEGFYRVDRGNRLGAGYDYFHTTRERPDFPKTSDNKVYAEWKNTALDWMDTRLRYQYLQRRSTFTFDPASPNPIDAFVRRFDYANVNQHLIKARFNTNPWPLVELGLDVIYKKNDYTDTILGRTNDDRQEYYLSAGYGDPNRFRVYGFVDYEIVKLDSFHRVGTGNPNPATPPTATTYNWTARNKDKSWEVGLGADWKQSERLTWNTSVIYAETRGAADFTAQSPPGVVAGGLLPIPNFDNTSRIALNLKGTYSYDKNWQFTGGYAYERYRYSDIAYDGMSYIAPGATAAQNSYYTGRNAFYPYNANIVYLLATYKF